MTTKTKEALYYTEIYVNTEDDSYGVKNEIKKLYTKDILSISTKAELQAANSDKIDGIFQAINSYTRFAMLIGIIGIVNNVVACFLERKKSMAMYQCIGMSKRGLQRMLVAESLIAAIVGVGLGLFSFFFIAKSIPIIVYSIWGSVVLTYSWKSYLFLGGCAVIAMLFVSIVPLMKTQKLSIMESLKSE